MANTFNLGNGSWAQKTEKLLAYNAENDNYKPLPFDFDRASTATRVNRDGLIETVGVDKPRIDFLNNTKGHLLLEPQRTNLFPYSEDFSQSSWGKYNTTQQSNQIISPDGSQNADALFETTDNNYHIIYDTISSSADTEYNFSVFVKKLNRRYVGIQGFYSSTRGNIAFFDLDNGTLEYTFSEGTGYSVSDAKIEEYPNGWYRLSANFTAPDTQIYMGLCLADENWSSGTAYDNIYTGDTSKGVYLWGAQLEQGSYATSYIPTQGETNGVTRSAETCNGAGNSTVFNDSEGVLYAEFAALTEGGTSRRISISDGTASNRIVIENDEQSGRYRFFISGGVTTIELTHKTGVTEKNYNKIAVSWNGANSKVYFNGEKTIPEKTDTPTISGLSVLQLQNSQATGSNLEGKVKDVRVYNTALTDAELIALTS